MHQIEGSLRRLQSNHVDVLYLHMEDPATAIEETLPTVGDIIRQGKVR